MTRIILTRHGHVDGIHPPRFRGRLDLPLTALGREQAGLLADHLATHGKPDAIYSSPLSRCVDTAAIIARRCGVRPEILSALLDFDYGEWTGKTHDEVKAADPMRYAQWWSRPQLVRPPQGEALQDIVARTADAVRSVLEQHRDETVVLVGHDSTNRAMLLTLLDQPLSAFWRFEQSPCAVTEIDITDNTVHVLSVNREMESQPVRRVAASSVA